MLFTNKFFKNQKQFSYFLINTEIYSWCEINYLYIILTLFSGVRFDVREFNEVVVNTSRIPLYVLEDVVNEWMISKNQQPIALYSSAADLTALPILLIALIFLHML